MSLYDVASLSNTPSLSTAVLSEVISLSTLSGLIAIVIYIRQGQKVDVYNAAN